MNFFVNIVGKHDVGSRIQNQSVLVREELIREKLILLVAHFLMKVNWKVSHSFYQLVQGRRVKDKLKLWKRFKSVICSLDSRLKFCKLEIWLELCKFSIPILTFKSLHNTVDSFLKACVKFSSHYYFTYLSNITQIFFHQNCYLSFGKTFKELKVFSEDANSLLWLFVSGLWESHYVFVIKNFKVKIVCFKLVNDVFESKVKVRSRLTYEIRRV